MGLRGFANTPIVTEGRLPWSQWCYCPWSLWRYCRPQVLGEGESLTPQTQMKGGGRTRSPYVAQRPTIVARRAKLHRLFAGRMSLMQLFDAPSSDRSPSTARG